MLITALGSAHIARSAGGRNRIAEAAGYTVSTLGAHEIPIPTVLIDWGHITDDNLAGHWETPPADPLIVLIAHSDSDGIIPVELAGPLADRLEELLPALGDEAGGGHIGLYRDKTRTFINGLRLAVERADIVQFS